MENAIAVTIKSGKYEGRTGWMEAESKIYNGKVFVAFAGLNYSGAYIALELISIDAAETESTEEVKTDISNPRFVAFFVDTNSRNKHDFRSWVNAMIQKFCEMGVITNHAEFDLLIIEDIEKRRRFAL